MNGPGIPANTTITVGSDPHSVTLNPPSGTSITTPAGVQQFTFTSATSIAPSLRYTQPGYTITNGSSSASNGVVMWYHSLTAENPNNDAPFQLIEMSFRGTFYNPTINVGTGFNYLIGFDTTKTNYISANDFDLVNYDVSYVDAIALPVALEADQVPIPNTPQSRAVWLGRVVADDQRAARRIHEFHRLQTAAWDRISAARATRVTTHPRVLTPSSCRPARISSFRAP